MGFLKITFVIVFCLECLQVFPQTAKEKKSLDSLVAVLKTHETDTAKCLTLNRISKFYVYRDADAGIKFAKQGLAFAQHSRWQKGIGISRLYIGMHLTSKGDYVQSLENLKVAQKILSKGTDLENLAKTYNELGILKANQSKFPESLDYFFLTLKTYEKITGDDMRYSLASCYENIGTVYNLTESPEKAIINYKKAVEILSGLKGRDMALAMNIMNLGTTYQQQGKYAEAIANYLKAEQILVPLHDNFCDAFVNSWLGSAYLEQEKYALSIEKLDKALLLARKSGDKQLGTTIIQNLGRAHLKKASESGLSFDLQQAYQHISSSLKTHLELGNREGLIKDYQSLSEYHKLKKDYKESLAAHEQYMAYKDSIFNSKTKQSLQNLQDERTIELRDKQIQLNAVTLESKEKEKWFYIFGIAALLIIGGLISKQSLNRKKTNGKLVRLNTELDQANKTKARFFSILNHDLRSPVSNLIHFLHLQKDSPELLDEESKARMENKTISSAENLLESMEDILLWSKGQMENFKPQFRTVRVDSLFIDTRKHFSSVENIVLLFENREDLKIETDENYLKTIMRNLTGNALKALENTTNATVTWKAFSDKGKSYLSVFDNGPGGTAEQFKALYDDTQVVGIKTGLGLHLIRDLAKAIHCKIDVDTKPGEGTTVTLTL